MPSSGDCTFLGLKHLYPLFKPHDFHKQVAPPLQLDRTDVMWSLCQSLHAWKNPESHHSFLVEGLSNETFRWRLKGAEIREYSSLGVSTCAQKGRRGHRWITHRCANTSPRIVFGETFGICVLFPTIVKSKECAYLVKSFQNRLQSYKRNN